jgi:hypothetical protein
MDHRSSIKRKSPKNRQSGFAHPVTPELLQLP